jgi:hypothetical protein
VPKGIESAKIFNNGMQRGSFKKVIAKGDA